MAEDTITDGKRIAQLLASELTGLETGALSAVDVVDADPDATPTDAGTFAYRVVAEKTELAEVFLCPTYAELEFTVEPVRTPAAENRDLFRAGRIVQITTGAEVKPTVDLIRETAAKQL